MEDNRTNAGEELKSSFKQTSNYLPNAPKINQKDIKGISNSLKSLKNIIKPSSGIGKASATGTTTGTASATGAATGAASGAAGGTAAASAGAGAAATSPVLIIVVIVLVLIIIAILLMPNGLMNQDDEVRSESSYNSALLRATEKTKEAISPKYDVVLENANKKINKYLEDNYSEYKEYISLNVIADDIDVVSRNVTGYIQSVNGVIQNWMPRDKDDVYSPGYDLKTGKITKETEYNTIGEAYKKVVSKFAENDFFYIGEVVEDIYDKEIKIPIVDEKGVHLKDLITGKYLYDTKTVKAGTLYLDVSYNVSEYKTNDIDKAIIYMNRDYYQDQLDEATSSALVYDAIYEMLYVLTGSYEIPAPHTDHYSYLMRGENLGYSGFIGELIDLKDIPKGKAYARDSNEGYSIWKEVYDNAEGHYPVYKGGYTYQCVDFAKYMFFKTYSLDPASNDGWMMAQSTVNKYPDKFAISSSPAPGSIFSTWGGYGVNHVGFVVGVSGSKITFCDGNVKINGTGGGIRWYVTMEIKDFENIWNGCVHYAVPIS